MSNEQQSTTSNPQPDLWTYERARKIYDRLRSARYECDDIAGDVGADMSNPDDFMVVWGLYRERLERRMRSFL